MAWLWADISDRSTDYRGDFALPRARRAKWGRRSAFRETVLTASLAGMIWGWSREGVAEREAEELNLNVEDRRLKLTLELAR